MEKAKVMEVIKEQVNGLNIDDYTLTKDEMMAYLEKEADERGLFEMEKGVCNEGDIPWCSIEFTEEITKLIAAKKK
ncbi:MAG: hypothetical protein Q4G61_02810 [Tissierellia bacterium]|nr:hypothetical protein [Tissierellia bacterium]